MRCWCRALQHSIHGGTLPFADRVRASASHHFKLFRGQPRLVKSARNQTGADGIQKLPPNTSPCSRCCDAHLILLLVRMRIHWGMGRFCLSFLAKRTLVRRDLLAGCEHTTGGHGQRWPRMPRAHHGRASRSAGKALARALPLLARRPAASFQHKQASLSVRPNQM